jgi:hypothetical protein
MFSRDDARQGFSIGNVSRIAATRALRRAAEVIGLKCLESAAGKDRNGEA